ncbi:MAG: hypothetical protein K9J25_04905 [Bacteroidales bacterium]|nr:hypothetical protein [Bacteroidales bacterium]
MVLKKIHISILLACMILMTACEELYIVDCSQCETTEPTTCLLEIQLGESRSFNIIYDVTIYRGRIEDGVIIENLQTSESINYPVALNSEYTVTSTFTVNGKEYTAIDATRPKVDLITDMCEETCYWVYNNNVNLGIKYY